MSDNYTPGPIRFEPVMLPNGRETTFDEMRAALSKELYNVGDCRLVWINEGDLIMHSMVYN